MGGRGDPPIGVGGVTPLIGIATKPPPYVPLSTGAPNTSCTLRTSKCAPARTMFDRLTDTVAWPLQL